MFIDDFISYRMCCILTQLRDDPVMSVLEASIQIDELRARECRALAAMFFRE
jgi:hypothetical protein